MNKKYQPIIGLEIHVELRTKQKMFCGCNAEHFQVKPNTHTCPVCLGMPGALPVTNRQAIEWCQLIGLALNCKLAKFSKFDRKNYFYPDLAKSYQISQLDKPLCGKGEFTLESGKKMGVTRVHMEEDTGKNVHKDGQTMVDFNRCGVPLVEIVTEPDFRNKEDVNEFLKGLRQIIRSLGVSDADMEKGSMRLELNMSLAKIPSREGQTEHSDVRGVLDLPDYKVEVKNINSFRYLQKAIDYEYDRQTEILESGKTPDQETRGWQEDVGKTISQRSKEDSQDYRYFPEPDLPPMTFTDDDFNKLKSQLPELPQAKISRFIKDFDLDSETASFIIEGSGLAQYFEQAIKIDKKISPKQIANVIKNKKFNWKKLSPEELVSKMKSQSSSQISEEGELIKIIEKVISENPKIVEEYKAGKDQVIGFLIGQVMKATSGKADAKVVQNLLRKMLS